MYKKQDYERDIKILQGAPDEAVNWCVDTNEHIAEFTRGGIDDLEYFHAAYQNGDWVEVEIYGCEVRSLSDIRALVSMYEQLQGDINE